MPTPEEHALPTRRSARERERREAAAHAMTADHARPVPPQQSNARSRTSSPPPAPTRTSQPVRTPKVAPRRGARRTIAALALTFVGAMVVATSLPAAALFPDAHAITQATSFEPENQSLQGTAGESEVVARDGYSATSMEEIEQRRAAVAPARTASTFVNNTASPIQWPFVTGVPLSDDFGPRAAPCSGCSTFHKGLDMIPGEGTQIQAIADGVVRETGSSDSGLGVYAMIDHVVDGKRYTSVYAHMQFGSLKLTEGQPVTVGQPVGNVGNTGQSTGPHLHLELLQNGTDPIDPFAWLQANVQL